MWTTENTVVALGYLALIGGLWSIIFWLERRTRLLAQIVEVKARLTATPKLPIYRAVIQMNSDGSLVSLKSRSKLKVGDVVTVELGTGMVCAFVPGSRPLGLVVESKETFE